MQANKMISPLLIAGILAASVSTNAFAGDRRHHDSGNNGALIAAGIIGAVVIGSLIANSNSNPEPPAQVYVPPQPQPYYAPPQVVYQPPPQYHAPPVVRIEGGYHERRGYRDRYYREQDRYYRY